MTDEVQDDVGAEEGADDILFMKDGRVRVVANGVAYMLRRPNLGLFKKYRLLITNPADELNDGETDIDFMVRYLREMFSELSDRPLPDDDNEIAPWLPSAMFAVQLVAHWQEVPLARGARAAQGNTQPNVTRIRPA